MKKNAWNRKIKECCEEVGTYRESFDSVIETLAQIMEMRDDAIKKYEESGGEPTVVKSYRGEANVYKNPAIEVINGLNSQALAYWRDLGLTPAGLKKINEASLSKKEEASELEKAMMKLEKQLGDRS